MRNRLNQTGMRKLWLLALWASFFAGSLAWATETLRDPVSYFFHQNFGDLQEEAGNAREAGQIGVLVMFEEASCPWCKRMKARVLNRARVQDYFRKYFRILTVDTQGDTPLTNFKGKAMSEKEFAFKQLRVRATPVFAFFDLNGKLMMRYTGSTRDVKEFLWLGEFVVEGHYKTKKFTKFKREKRRQAASS